MKNQQATKLFAFKLAEKKAVVAKPETQWKARDAVAVAGCTGPDARSNSRNGSSDAGIWC